MYDKNVCSKRYAAHGQDWQGLRLLDYGQKREEDINRSIKYCQKVPEKGLKRVREGMIGYRFGVLAWRAASGSRS